MKTFISKVTLLIFSVLLSLSCTNTFSNKKSRDSETASSRNSDSIEITTLIRNIYKWQEAGDSIKSLSEFFLASSGTILTGIDWSVHERRLNELTNTNFFAKEFLDNYHKIALQIDSIIKFSKIRYDLKLIPPFVPDANQWCKCQMSPPNYWEKLTLINFKDYRDSASFNWSFGQDHSYLVKTKKIDGSWKISYLEGFDKKIYSE